MFVWKGALSCSFILNLQEQERAPFQTNIHPRFAQLIGRDPHRAIHLKLEPRGIVTMTRLTFILLFISAVHFHFYKIAQKSKTTPSKHIRLLDKAGAPSSLASGHRWKLSSMFDGKKQAKELGKNRSDPIRLSQLTVDKPFNNPKSMYHKYLITLYYSFFDWTPHYNPYACSISQQETFGCHYFGGSAV
jgi:hypothetical protein